MTLGQLVFRYSAFAVLATVANLGTQRISLAAYDGAFALGVAIFFGTGVGLVVKYVLVSFFEVLVSITSPLRQCGLSGIE